MWQTGLSDELAVPYHEMKRLSWIIQVFTIYLGGSLKNFLLASRRDREHMSQNREAVIKKSPVVKKRGGIKEHKCGRIQCAFAGFKNAEATGPDLPEEPLKF